MNFDRYRIKPGTKVKLARRKPDDARGLLENKKTVKQTFEALDARLDELQEIMYAQGKHKLLVVLQAMDTGGKDGIIRRVFRGVNPQGVKVASFKVPTSLELAHDYLWRVHPHVPARGEIVIFNRSHYEDVLVVRVRELVPEAVWRRRFDHINDFERMLADEGATILKFFLHISKDEQKSRLQARLDDPTKHWKFNIGDLAERERWDAYMQAYEDVLSRTSTPWAPWYVVPSNAKWRRDLIVASILVETLEKMKMAHPSPKEDLTGVVIP